VGVVADLVLIALGIALQPFRLSAFILILSTKGGTKKGLGFILGWLACLVLVIAVVVLITGGKPVRFQTIPSTVVLISKLALGIALIVIAADWLILPAGRFDMRNAATGDVSAGFTLPPSY
jgi:Sap-like sulfolipid-1-addressing protein